MIRACSTLVFRPFALSDALRGVGEAGFENVELGAIKGFLENLDPDRVSNRALGRARDELRRCGLRCVSLSAHAPLHTRIGRKRLGNGLRIAGELGARAVNTQTGDPETDDDLARMRENVLALADEALELGVRLCLETDSGLLPSGLAGARILADLGHPGLALNYDPGNVRFLTGLDPVADVEHALPWLGHVHLKDQRGGVGRKEHPPLGEGELDVPAFVRRLEDAGFAEPVSLEIEFGPDGWPDWEGCLAAARRSRRYWDAVSSRSEG